MTSGGGGQDDGMDDERDEETPAVHSAPAQATGDGGAGADPADDDGYPDPREGEEGRNISSTSTGEGGGKG